MRREDAHESFRAEKAQLVTKLQALYDHMVQAKAAEDRAMSSARARGGALMQEMKTLEGRIHGGAVAAAGQRE